MIGLKISDLIPNVKLIIIILFIINSIPLQAYFSKSQNFKNNLEKNILSKMNEEYNSRNRNELYFNTDKKLSAKLSNYSRSINFQNAQPDKTDKGKGDKPPLEPLRIAGEIVAGSIGGSLGFITTVGATGASGQFKGRSGVGQIVSLGILIGYPLGSALGVYTVGTMGDQTGSFWGTYVWSYGGLYLGSIIIYSITYLLKHYTDIKTEYALVLSAPIGATVGFNISRRYEQANKNAEAILQYENGELSFQIPAAHYRYSLYNKNTFTTNIFQIKF